MKSSDKNETIFKAFITAQAQMDGVKKNATNPHFKKKYADLGAVCEAVMDKLSDQGIGVIQWPVSDQNGVGVETILIHSSGEWLSGEYTLPLAKQDPQAAGSAITYARRYALMAICGIVPEDDDGNAASGRDAKKDVDPPARPKILSSEDLISQQQALYAAKDMKELAAIFSSAQKLTDDPHQIEIIVTAKDERKKELGTQNVKS